MLTQVNKNKWGGAFVMKRSNPVTGQVYEYQVHVPNYYKGSRVVSRHDSKREADAAIDKSVNK